jgi:hypothetical protein
VYDSTASFCDHESHESHEKNSVIGQGLSLIDGTWEHPEVNLSSLKIWHDHSQLAWAGKFVSRKLQGKVSSWLKALQFKTGMKPRSASKTSQLDLF